MAVAYTIDEEYGIVLSRGWGTVTDEDLVVHTRAMGVDPRFKPHFSQLSDMRSAVRIAATDPSLRRLAALNPFGAGAKRAVVAEADGPFGIVRLYQAVRGPSIDTLEVFRDMDAAFEWLGLSHVKERLLRELAESPPLTGDE